jgi:hypothetical protein
MTADTKRPMLKGLNRLSNFSKRRVQRQREIKKPLLRLALSVKRESKERPREEEIKWRNKARVNVEASTRVEKNRI